MSKIKTDTFFIISNYNTDPESYLEYCTDYYIYDQSDQAEYKSLMEKKYQKISFVENSGHSITNSCRFFVDNYDHLPERMMLVKGNLIGRHISQEHFDRVYQNRSYTMLFDNRKAADKPGVAYQLYDGAFLEINNSWYGLSKPGKYFRNYNDFLRCFFIDPIIPQWNLFCPGACYIVTKDQVLKYPKTFWQSLMKIGSYCYFPVEAYHIERMLHVIFCGNYEVQEHCLDEKAFDQFLQKAAKKTKAESILVYKIKRKLNEIKNAYHYRRTAMAIAVPKEI